jgi:GT2 family glycosyltransferase
LLRLLQIWLASLATWAKLRRYVNWHAALLAAAFVKKHGMVSLINECAKRLFRQPAYRRWIEANEPTPGELLAQRSSHFSYEPLISIIVPTVDTPPNFLVQMAWSVLNQTYPRWQLCLADGHSRGTAISSILEQLAHLDHRVRVAFLSSNRGIAGNSNAALKLATGDFVTFLDHDDLLAPFALWKIVSAIQRTPDVDLIYSDEDKIDASASHRTDPHFKPDWSPDTLRSQNYLTHMTALQKRLIDSLGGLRPGFDGSQDYDLMLRATERATTIVHIPHVLYHWRCHSQSVADNMEAKPYAYEAGRRALVDHLGRIGYAGAPKHGRILGTYHVCSTARGKYITSLIVDAGRTGRATCRFWRRMCGSDTGCVEVVMLQADAGASWGLRSGDRHQPLAIRGLGLSSKMPLPERLNAAAREASGDILVFLGPEIFPLSPDWLQRLTEHAARTEVGAVGAKLYLPNGFIMHAGFIVGPAGVVGMPHHHFSRTSPGYACRLVTIQNVSAVSGDCLAIRKAVFDEVGGFDPHYHEAYHDVDLCLKLRICGRVNVWTPMAELSCHGGARPLLTGRRQRHVLRDRRYYTNKWVALPPGGDPYYNPNLSTAWEDCGPAEASDGRG